MAGTYPTPPGPEIPYDKPGFSRAFLNQARNAVVREPTATELTQMIELQPTYPSSIYTLAIVFPENYDIAGWVLGGYASPVIYTSTDTTTGVDGTWTSRTGGTTGGTSPPSYADYRNAATAQAFTGIKGVQAYATQARLYGLKLYGKKSTNGGLMLWHPTLDQPLDHANLETGDVVDAEVNDITFRVKNLTGALATNVTVSMEDQDPLTTFAGMHTIDYNGGGFGALPSNIGSLADNAISNVFTLRQTISAATLGLAFARIVVDAD